MRKLVTIQEILDVRPIEGADKIEVVDILGWSVVSQKGNFKKGDMAVYVEIDSCFSVTSPLGLSLPIEKAGRVHTEDGFIENGFRIKTIKLRGQVSQGYALPLKYFEDFPEINILAGDLSKELGVVLYEKPFLDKNPLAAGSFPSSLVVKTDQERIENIFTKAYQAYLDEEVFEVSYKLDGSSLTVGYSEEESYICSRNLALKLDQTSSNFVKQGSIALDLLKKADKPYIFLQGELLAPNIQGNFEGVTTPQVHFFSVFDSKAYKYLNPKEAKLLVESLGLNYVPLFAEEVTLKELLADHVIQNSRDFLKAIKVISDGPSALAGKFREGLVFKSLTTGFSFKSVGNRYLLKTGN